MTKIDELVGHKIPVLNDGFIRLVDLMGDDTAIVQAARISYGKGTKKTRSDEALIRYLMRHRHTSPFEMCEVKLHVRVPMDCWRQWIRHRTANVNEYSTRYSESINSAQSTSPDGWRQQTLANRQGSGGTMPQKIGVKLSQRESDIQRESRRVYEERIAAGIAREQARKDLPLSTYTEAYWKIDLHNLLHFLALRMDAHAQEEIRNYANVIGHQIVAKWCPITWQAFLDYRLNATNFSATESKILGCILRGEEQQAISLAEELGWLAVVEGRLKTNRERQEFEDKLDRLGGTAPWSN